MNPLIQLAIAQLPSIIAAIKDRFRKQDPTAPVPTDAEVMAAFESAYQSSLAKDEAWLAAHPGS